MKNKYDFVVIGGGSAGYAAASTAAGLGLEVALIEGGAEIGGLCILRGCMPSKTLIESGNRALTIRRAREFGLRADGLVVVPEEIMRRKRMFVADFAEHRKEQLQTGAFDFIRGMAAFAGPNTVEVTDLGGGPPSFLEAKTFLVATGSRSDVMEIPGLLETGFRDSDAVLECAEIPESVIILGGGATALEFAHYYASVGARVTIVQRSAQVLRDMDLDVATALEDAFRRRGISLFLGTKLLRVEAAAADKKRVYFEQEGRENSVEACEIVYALGRVPHLGGLRLERAGAPLEKCRLATSATQTAAPHIFAAGDAAGPYEIVHIAIQQGEVAARNAAKLVRGASEPLEKTDYRLKLFAIFCMPEVATAGMTEKELTAAGIPYHTAGYPFEDHGKALVMGETEGFVKLIAARDSREILGAAVVGPHASELIHEIVVAMYFRATAGDLAQVPHYHPTLSEIWTHPAEQLARGA